MPPKVKQMIREQEEQKIFKEFEELGYEREKREHIILLYNRKIDKMIGINTMIRGYGCYDSDCVGLTVTLQEHSLLHKLFKLWGWFDE